MAAYIQVIRVENFLKLYKFTSIFHNYNYDYYELSSFSMLEYIVDINFKQMFCKTQHARLCNIQLICEMLF